MEGGSWVVERARDRRAGREAGMMVLDGAILFQAHHVVAMSSFFPRTKLNFGFVGLRNQWSIIKLTAFNTEILCYRMHGARNRAFFFCFLFVFVLFYKPKP